MNDQNFELMAGLVGKSYTTQAADSRRRREKRVRVSGALLYQLYVFVHFVQYIFN